MKKSASRRTLRVGTRRLLVWAVLSAGLVLGWPSKAMQPISDAQHLTTSGRTPESLSPSDWSRIRAAYEAARHRVYAVASGGHQARNPGHQWRTRFDGRGFLVQPDAQPAVQADAQPGGAGWKWGLELTAYGFPGHERALATGGGGAANVGFNFLGFAAGQQPLSVNTCPTTFTINSNGDAPDANPGDEIAVTAGGVTTLRAAIQEANALPSCGTITINATGVSGTINLGSALPNIDHNVNINGPGAVSLTVRRNTGGDYRIFTINNGKTVAISGLTISNGHFNDGAGINNGGTLTLTNSTLSGNQTVNGADGVGGDGGNGGGIYNSGMLTVTNSTLTGNQTGKGGSASPSDVFNGGEAGDGGGIYNSGTLNVTNSTLSANQTGDGGHASEGRPGGDGGGIYNSGTLNVTNSTLGSNHTGRGAGGILGGSGGNGGGIYNIAGTLTVTNSTLDGNSCGDGDEGGSTFNSAGGSGGSGGGILNLFGTVTITNSTLSGNQAGNGAENPNDGGDGGSGGGIFNQSANLTITNSTLSGNQAGAGNYFEGGGGGGGGIFNFDSTMTVTNSTLSGNQTKPGKNGAFGGDGGGISNHGIAIFKNSIVANSPLGENCADSGTFIVSGTNFDTDGTCPGFTQVTSGQLNLGALANNGGPTMTHALQSGSVAIDIGSDVTTLNGAIDNSTNTVVVIDGTSIPGGIGFLIQIDNEQMSVTSKSTNTLTVARGANGTTAAAHIGGAAVNPAFDQRGNGFPRRLDGNGDSTATVDVGSVEAPTVACATAPTASNGGPFCEGGTIQLSTPFVTGGTYSWTGPNGFTSSAQNPSRANATMADAGTYSVTVTVNGCTSAAGTTSVVVKATPATPSASNGGPYCEGQTIQLSTPTVAGATYSWTGPNGFASSAQNPTRANAAMAHAGTYSVTITVNGCTSAAGTTGVVVKATPATPTASNTGSYLAGATIQLSTPTVSGATYAWTGPNSFTSSAQNPTRANATTADAGTYSVTITVNGCTSAAGTTSVMVLNSCPTSFTVNSNGEGADANPGDGVAQTAGAVTTLRAAIQEANALGGCGTIDINFSGVTSPINLASALPNIDHNVNINGPGAASLTVRRNTGDYRIFTINNGKTVAISGLTISDGNSNDGGGINNAGILTLTNCTVSGNQTPDGVDGEDSTNLQNGGGIYNSGTLTVTNSTVSGNHTGNGSTINLGEGLAGGDGGGIYNSGTLTVTNSTLSGNQTGSGAEAHGDGDADGGNGGDGGGIYNSGTLTVTNSTISSNQTGVGGESLEDVGGVGGVGGGIFNSNFGMLTVINSTLSGNRTGSGGEGVGPLSRGGSGGGGGGIFNQSSLTVINSTLSGNQTGDGTEGPTASSGGSGGSGGGIYNQSSLTVTNCTLSGNQTGNGGIGGAGGSGGGIFNISPGSVNARNTIIAGNTANLGPDFRNTLISQGYNLIGNNKDATITPSPGTADQIGTPVTPINPLLGPLASNGGPTQTLALLTGSPAIDKGVAATHPISGLPITTDQRGSTRPVDDAATTNAAGGNGSDIGAFEKQAPTAVKLAGFTASAYGAGVLLNWQTGFEVDNLGFNVYREVNGTRTRITSQLVAGSALSDGPGTSLLSGHNYYWADTPPSGKGVRYWLEDIDLNGKSTLNGPYSITSPTPGSPSDAQRRSALISQIGLRQSVLANGLGSVPLTRAATLAAPTASALQLQSDLASKAAVKLAVKQEGYYRVTQVELLRAKLDPKVDPRLLQLFVDGVEQPIKVTGEQDGRFDASDAIEFYGVGLDVASTDTRVYWLVAGTKPGKRIPITQGKGDPIASGGFPFTVERKDRTIYFSALRNGEAENFFGAIVASQPVDQLLSIQHLDQTAQAGASLEVSLQGVTTLAHNVRVLLNGADVTRLSFTGQSQGRKLVSISQSLLREGENTVRLIAEGGPSDITLVDVIRISYSHSFTADSDGLALTAPASRQVSVSGFTRKDIRLMDVTDASGPQEIAATVAEGKNGVTVSGTASGSGTRAVLAFSDSQAKHPWSITANQPSSLRQAGNGADLLIITQRDYFAAVEPLKALRQSQGLSVAVVDIEDIYDELSFGNNTAEAVKGFSAYAASSWKKKPRFVLLAGDASYDPRNYLGFGDSDLVPTKLLDTVYMETASDDWFADFNNDGLPELAVGRLPFRNAAEASTMIEKILGYERSSASDEVLLVADANDGFDFESASAQLVGMLPTSFKVNQINRGTDTAGSKVRLMEAINRGQKLVNYAGHGSANQWRGDLLVNEDAAQMRNTDHLSVFVMMTCLNGYFDDAALDSLAESLLKAERGGAVAVWSSSGMCLPAEQETMNREFYRLVFGLGSRGQTLGETIRRAKMAARDVDVRRTWILLGDPAMTLR